MGGLFAFGNRHGTRCGRGCYGGLCGVISAAGKFARRWGCESRGQLRGAAVGRERRTEVVIRVRVRADNEWVERVYRTIGVAMGEGLG